MKASFSHSIFIILVSASLFSCSEPEEAQFRGSILRCGWISHYGHPGERINGGSLIFQVVEGSRNCDLVKISEGEETVLKTFELQAEKSHVLCSTPHVLGDDKLNIGFILNSSDHKGDGVDLEYETFSHCRFGGGYRGISTGGDLSQERDYIVFFRVEREPSDHEWTAAKEASIDSMKTATEANSVDYIVLKVVSETSS